MVRVEHEGRWCANRCLGDRDVAMIFYCHLTLPSRTWQIYTTRPNIRRWRGSISPSSNYPRIPFLMKVRARPRRPRKRASVYPNEPYQTWEGSILPLMHINVHTEMQLTPAFSLPLKCPWCHHQTRLHFDLDEQPGIRHEERCCADADITGNMRVKTFLNYVTAFLSGQSASASLHVRCASLDEESGLD